MLIPNGRRLIVKVSVLTQYGKLLLFKRTL